MKKLGIASAILGGIFVLSCIIVVVSLFAAGWRGSSLREPVSQQKTAVLGDQDVLTVDCGLADCVIDYAADGSTQLTATLTGASTHSNRLDFTVEQTDEGVNVTLKRPFQLFFFGFYEDYELRITVPETFEGSLRMDNGSGDTEILLTALQDVRLTSGAGEIKTGDMTTASFSADNSAGSIVTGSITAEKDIAMENSAGKISTGALSAGGKVTLSSSAGDIVADGLKAASANVRNSAGRTEIHHIEDTDLTARQSAGGIVCQYDSFAENQMDIENSAGRILLSLPAQAAFRLEASASAGQVRCEFPVWATHNGSSELSGAVGEEDASNLVRLHSSAGDVVIQQNGDLT